MSWTIINSLFRDNRAIGNGGNPPQSGTPGGGSGGAIYNDGNEMTLRVGARGSRTTAQREGGSAIFFVSNNRTGDVEIVDSVIRNNTGDGFSTHPSIFFLGRRITFIRSTVQ